jgi:hypothetical protein
VSATSAASRCLREAKSNQDANKGSDNPAQLRATGRAAQQYCDTSKEVREWARAEGYTRGAEAFIVEGFKQARIAAGLSEQV